MQQHRFKTGFSLVEALVAISVLLLAIVGPMTIAAKAQQSARYAREQNTAFFLAQEGLEAIVAIRGTEGIKHITGTGDSYGGWIDDPRMDDCFTANNPHGCDIHFDDADLRGDIMTCQSTGCPLYFDATNARAKYSHDVDGTLSPYTRSIRLAEVNVANDPNDAVMVTSIVTWRPTALAGPKQVIQRTFLYDIYDY